MTWISLFLKSRDCLDCQELQVWMDKRWDVCFYSCRTIAEYFGAIQCDCLTDVILIRGGHWWTWTKGLQRIFWTACRIEYLLLIFLVCQSAQRWMEIIFAITQGETGLPGTPGLRGPTGPKVFVYDCFKSSSGSFFTNFYICIRNDLETPQMATDCSEMLGKSLVSRHKSKMCFLFWAFPLGSSDLQAQLHPGTIGLFNPPPDPPLVLKME